MNILSISASLLLILAIPFLIKKLVNFIVNYIALQEDNKYYKSLLEECSRIINKLRAELYYAKRKENIQNQPVTKEIPEGTIEAVKFAMAKSHPDNGGNIKDFIKYRDVYEKLTLKNNRRT